MLIRVNETTWIHAVDVKRIYITHAHFRGKDKPRFDVNVETADNTYSSSFDDKAAAETAANQIVDIINLAEEKNHAEELNHAGD